MGCIFPMYIKNILKCCGFDNAQSIKTLSEADMNDLTTFAKFKMRNLIPEDAELEDYYHIFSTNPDEFEILLGHKRLLKQLVNYVNEMTELHGPSFFDINKESRNNKKMLYRPNLPRKEIYLQAPSCSVDTLTNKVSHILSTAAEINTPSQTKHEQAFSSIVMELSKSVELNQLINEQTSTSPIDNLTGLVTDNQDKAKTVELLQLAASETKEGNSSVEGLAKSDESSQLATSQTKEGLPFLSSIEEVTNSVKLPQPATSPPTANSISNVDDPTQFENPKFETTSEYIEYQAGVEKVKHQVLRNILKWMKENVPAFLEKYSQQINTSILEENRTKDHLSLTFRCFICSKPYECTSMTKKLSDGSESRYFTNSNATRHLKKHGEDQKLLKQKPTKKNNSKPKTIKQKNKKQKIIIDSDSGSEGEYLPLAKMKKVIS